MPRYKRKKRRAEQELEQSRTLMIIPCWSGRRREQNQIHSLYLLEYMLDKYKKIDLGAKMDICLVHHMPTPTELESMDELLYRQYRKTIWEADGAKTINGKIILLEKENKGFSMGCFNHAYQLFKNQYSYWFFNEDDNLILKDDFLKNNLNILLSHNNTAWIATNGLWPYRCGVRQRWAICGCNGLTSSKMMKLIGDKIPSTETGEKTINRSEVFGVFEKELANIISDPSVSGDLLPKHERRDTCLWLYKPSKHQSKARRWWRYQRIDWDESFILNPREGHESVIQ